RQRARVERFGNGVDAERAVGVALDISTARGALPWQQVGVMLHHRGDADVVAIEPQAVSEMIDRFGRIAADDGDVVAVSPSEGQRRGAGGFVSGSRVLRFPSGAPMDTRVVRQELLNAARDRG